MYNLLQNSNCTNAATEQDFARLSNRKLPDEKMISSKKGILKTGALQQVRLKDLSTLFLLMRGAMSF